MGRVKAGNCCRHYCGLCEGEDVYIANEVRALLYTATGETGEFSREISGRSSEDLRSEAITFLRSTPTTRDPARGNSMIGAQFWRPSMPKRGRSTTLLSVSRHASGFTDLVHELLTRTVAS